MKYRAFRGPFPTGSLLCLTGILIAIGLPAEVIAASQAPLTLQAGPVPSAPPPAPPIQCSDPGLPAPVPHMPKGLTLYSIGQPTDEEQLYLEFLNRMRANPTAEGQRLATTADADVLSAYTFFSVDTALMQSEFSTNPAVPPLAMNAQLTAAARWHSGDMYTNMYQGHSQTNGAVIMGPGDRVLSNGYAWSAVGENVYASSESVFYGHAGFAVDWGPGPGGMQAALGHRANMLSSLFREVGVGVVDGVNGSVGPQLVTQDFGTLSSPTPLISGVVYYDFNGNGFYDLGEGIGGVTVNTLGSKYYAITADSGGYAIPVTSNGNYTVTFSASGLSTQTVVAVSGLKNVKLDYVPIYSPPVISGPNPAALNQSNSYSFTPVAGATGYEWQETQLSAYTNVEGAESGLGNVTVSSSPGYSVIDNDLVASGSAAFHLAQPDANDQYLTLNPLLRPGSASALSFKKLLGWASTAQMAKAQVTTDGGTTWQDLWTQPGTDGSGDSTFSSVNLPLGSFAGQTIQLRFAYVFLGGSFFNQTSTGVGLYVDDISVSNADQLSAGSTSDSGTNTTFVFFPTNPTRYLLQVRALINSRTLNWGPAFTATTAAALPTLQVVGAPAISGNQVQIDFVIENFRAGMTFQLWSTGDPASTWTQDASATLQPLVANSKFRFTSPSGGLGQQFYRVKGSY